MTEEAKEGPTPDDHQPPSCSIDSFPDGVWKQLVLFLTFRDRAALYATDTRLRTFLASNKWSSRNTRAAERATLLRMVAVGHPSWAKRLEWGSSTGAVSSPRVPDASRG